jgi:hypothetical protein
MRLGFGCDTEKRRKVESRGRGIKEILMGTKSTPLIALPLPAPCLALVHDNRPDRPYLSAHRRKALSPTRWELSPVWLRALHWSLVLGPRDVGVASGFCWLYHW